MLWTQICNGGDTNIWKIQMQDVKEDVGQRKNNRLHLLSLLVQLPSPKW